MHLHKTPFTWDLVAVFALALAGCAGDPGADGAEGTDGTDGTDGTSGTSCTVTDNGDGTKTIACTDGTEVTVADGGDGVDGDDCSVVDNGDGTYTITCGTSDPVVVTDPGYVPAGYAAADGLVGGSAYAKWWVTQAGGPGTLAAASVTVGAEWVRCKTCHAWDGLGNAASYAARTGKSTGTASRPDVSSVDLRAAIASLTPQELFDRIQGTGGRPLDSQGNGHPDFSTALTDAQIWNLVKFMREEWITPNTLYYLAVSGPPVYTNSGGVVVAPTLTYYAIGADGDATAGDAVFSGSCAGCHGADGTTLDIGGRSVGEFVRTAPHETWFKAKFGEFHDDSTVAMDAGILTDTADLVDLYRALTNSTTYPDIP